ncbi:MAG: Dolichyl-phosphate-mannose-protein mannosyltransferase [Myxococcaceae bacterium]|nr:Dolichyl-phosphate-mannose-protein mannosyltransferase [Myxococcaceae bacterium]
MGVLAQRKHISLGLWVVLAAGLVASLTMVLIGFRAQGFVSNAGDPYHYSEIAHGFVEHGFDKVTRRAAMLYPHLLWGVYALGGNDIVVQGLHILMHMGSCALAFVIGRHLYNERTGLIAGLIVAFHPMLLRYVADLHTETLLAFLYTLTVWFAIRFYDAPSVRNGIWLGAIGMLGAIAKGVFLPFLVVYGVVWFVRGLRQRGSGKANPIPGVIAIAITMIVVVTPWTYRNYVVSKGKFVLLTPGSQDAFLRGYIFTRLEFATLQKPPYTDAENESNALFRRIAAESGTEWERDEIQDDVNNSREVKRMVTEHPLDTVRKVVVGLFTFWYEMTSLRNSLIPAVLAVVCWALAFVGFKRARDEQRPSWLLWLPIVVLNVFVATLVPLGRYSVPALPCLAVLAAYGVDTLVRHWTARSTTTASAMSS